MLYGRYRQYILLYDDVETGRDSYWIYRFIKFSKDNSVANTTQITNSIGTWASNKKGWWIQYEDGSYLTNARYQSPISRLWYYMGPMAICLQIPLHQMDVRSMQMEPGYSNSGFNHFYGGSPRGGTPFIRYFVYHSFTLKITCPLCPSPIGGSKLKPSYLNIKVPRNKFLARFEKQ